MTDSDKPQFMQLLAETLAAYGKPLPEAAMVRAWLANMAPYPMRVIESAFQSYLDENGEFAPVPAGIAKRCKLMDGRPGAEEAWAIALTGRDEANSLVWTTEMAEAFAICRPVLDTSGPISARKPFLEAYERIVTSARAARRPAEWVASVGWDGQQHAQVLAKAISAGLLPAPAVAGLLEGKRAEPTPDGAAREQLAAVKKLLADGLAAKERARVEHAEREFAETEKWKQETNAAVARRLAETHRHAARAPIPVRSDVPIKNNAPGGR